MDVNGFNVGIKPTDINAVYIPYLNSIMVSAAILDAPYYIEGADEMVNMGRIGTVIAHEISHAFDSEGVLFNARGSVDSGAMSAADTDAFNAIKDKCAEYYDTFSVLGAHVNGVFTLSENLADLAGMQCCLAVAKTPENQKTIFENYAQLWEGTLTDTQAMDDLKIDTHSPDWVRVNAVVASFDEYYDIYGVKEGDQMYVAPEDRVRRW